MVLIPRNWDTSPEKRFGDPHNPTAHHFRREYLKGKNTALKDIQEFSMNCGITCETHKGDFRTGKLIARFGVGCNHILRCDEVNPAPVFLMPGQYYLCKTCLRLYQAYKFDFDKMLVIDCGHCIDLKVSWIKQQWPDRFTDLSKGTEVEAFDPTFVNLPGKERPK